MVGSWQDDRLRLFRDAKDYRRFLERLGEAVELLNIRIYLFCLMANHYHLVLETPEGNLSRFMQKLSTAYTVYYNRRHQRHGHLLDGRFKAKLVEGDEYLLKLSRYVHLNPVQVVGWKNRPINDRIEHLRAYRWSSYPDFIGGSNIYGFLDKRPVLAERGGGVRRRPSYYREFVETGLAEDDLELKEALEESSLGIGGEAFQQSIWGLHRQLAAVSSRPEDVAFRRTRESVDAKEVLRMVAAAFNEEVSAFGERRRNSPLRAVASRFLLRYAGRTQREVAELLGMSTGAAVSTQAKRYEVWLRGDRRLRRLATELERRLEGMKEKGRIKTGG
ncbi:MAG: transposase [Opitutales bacterium]